MRSAARRLGWWMSLAALWVLLAGSTDPVELAAAAVFAALAVALAELYRSRTGMVALRWPPGAGRYLLRLPWEILRDTGLLAAALYRLAVRGQPVEGALVALDFEPGSDPESAARQALVVAGGSITPNTVVVGVDDDASRLLVHRLVDVPSRRSADRTWPL